MGVPSSIRKVVCRIEGTNLLPPSPQESKFSMGKGPFASGVRRGYSSAPRKRQPVEYDQPSIRWVRRDPWNLEPETPASGTMNSRKSEYR